MIPGMTSRGATQARPRRVRKSPEARRAEIVGCATELALRDGLETVTLRSVSTALGITGGLVGHYFPSVDDLLAEVFRTVTVAELDDILSAAAEQDAPARLRSVLHQLVADDRDPVSLLLLDGWHAGRRRPAVRAAVDAVMTAWSDRLAGLLRDGVTEGTWAVPDPVRSATRILAVVDGHAIAAVLRGSVDYAPVRDLVLAVAERELGLPDGSLA